MVRSRAYSLIIDVEYCAAVRAVKPCRSVLSIRAPWVSSTSTTSTYPCRAATMSAVSSDIACNPSDSEIATLLLLLIFDNKSSMSALKPNKKLLFVNGLADEVTVETLKAAFLPFGEVVECQIPVDYKTRTIPRQAPCDVR